MTWGGAGMAPLLQRSRRRDDAARSASGPTGRVQRSSVRIEPFAWSLGLPRVSDTVRSRMHCATMAGFALGEISRVAQFHPSRGQTR